MGKKTRYTIQLLVVSLCVMLLTTFLFTDNFILSQPDDTPSEGVELGGIEDGVYTGTGEGFDGPIEVEVTIEEGKISDVTVLSHSETEGVSDPAFAEIPNAIIENNSTDVDVASGATFSSEGIIAAVNDALGTDSGEAEDPASGNGVSDAGSDGDFKDGTYTATVDGHNGPLEVEVVVEDGTITEVNILDHEETEGLADSALSDVPAAIVENNSVNVDTVSGATVTSDAIIEAVEAALADAVQ